MGLVQLRLFSTSQPRVVWHKTSTQRSITSSSSSAGLLHSPLISLGSTSFLVYIISWMLTQSSWSHLPPTRCRWKRLLSSMPPTQLIQHIHWENTILFTLGNRCTFCYATHTLYAECQRDFSSQYSTLYVIFYSDFLYSYFYKTLKRMLMLHRYQCFLSFKMCLEREKNMHFRSLFW